MTQEVSGKNEGKQVKGLMTEVNAQIIRPADTNAYIANDTIADKTSGATIITFASVARRNGGGGYITGLRIGTNKDDFLSQFRLHLFKTAPTVLSDNAPMTAPLYADIASYLGHITLSTAILQAASSAVFAQQDTTIEPPVAIPYMCADGSRDIYGMLETRIALTPASAQKFDIRMMIEVN